MAFNGALDLTIISISKLVYYFMPLNVMDFEYCSSWIPIPT